MSYNKNLLELDYLVYSSHKSATQSLTKTLNTNGFKAVHCHLLRDIGLNNHSFLQYLDSYVEKNQKKINIISIFREPIERHISSFFQYYGSRPLVSKEVESMEETIIFQSSLEELQNMFITEIKEKSLKGIEESLFEMAYSLTILPIEDLEYNAEHGLNSIETKHITLHYCRFDHLTQKMAFLLERLTGQSIEEKPTNLSHLKWYSDIYSQFKASLQIPEAVIEARYKDKKNLINIFYNNNYHDLLNNTKQKYA